MESQPEVSSTMTEDAEVVIEIEVSPGRNGISLAEAANALITLQVPSKEDSTAQSPKSGEEQKMGTDDINPKDFRKKILEGMKSQFNTNLENDVTEELTNRRGPLRSKSKFKRHDYDNDEDDSTDMGVKPDISKPPRGRGRPPRLTPSTDKTATLSNGVKVETSGKSEKDSSSEAGSERGDSTSVSPGAVTTRRSQRANISRTSATDLLKGLSDSRTARKVVPSDAEVNKSQETPRKRGRPAKTVPSIILKIESTHRDPIPTTEPVEEKKIEEDRSKVEHMASLGLLSKSNSELSINLQPSEKRARQSDSPVENQQPINGLAKNITKNLNGRKLDVLTDDQPMEGMVTIESTQDLSSEQEPIENGDHQAQELENSIALSRKSDYACCCADIRSPVVVTSPAIKLYCQAYDSVGGKLVGCCLIANRKRLYRPSKKVAFMILCDSHRDRIRKHFCCPGCGLFCTQGTFLQCRASEGSVHFFHESCQTPGQKGCLHCYRDTAISEARLQVKTCATPVFCNDPKLLRATPTAKISCVFPRQAPICQSETASPKYPSPKLVLPSGKIIDTSTISSALTKDIIERISKSLENCSKSQPNPNNKNLFLAAKNGDIERVVECLKQGQNANQVYRDHGGRTALHAAAANGHLAIVHVLVQSGAAVDKFDQSQNTALTLAIAQVHNDIVKYLVQAGCSTSSKGEGGMTPLHLASKQGNLEACHYMIATGNGLKSVNARDDGGWTPLVWGCEHQQIDIVRYLLQCRADPRIRDAEQNVALHWAAFSGSDDIVALLLDNGCEVNTANYHGDTPLHTASRRDNYGCVFLLVNRGARLDLKNNDGQLPIDVCPDKNCHSALLLSLNMKLKQHIQGASTDAEKILSNDVSKGKETNPIQCVNGVDEETVPSDYFYITENCFTSPLHVDRTINSLMRCECSGDCSTGCRCSTLSVQCWYDEEGKLTSDFNFSDPPMLFECNRACQCHRGSCNNRVVQHGITSRLTLFRIKDKGWGVRTILPIPRGSYVCEYIGEVISDFEADQREDDSYLFDLDDSKDGEIYCIDARRYGNIARFINHSCDPNLLPVKVFVDHQDVKFPRIAFFASRDIAANEELAFDYGEKFWIIKYKSFTCACLAENCKYSQHTIQRTVEEYRRSLQLENGFTHN